MNNSYVYFALKGDSFDPDLVSQRLGISPTKIHRLGDSIGKNGNKIKFAGWYLYSDIVDNLFVNKLVEEVISKLAVKIDIINAIKKDYGLSSILETVLYIDTNDEVSTPIIGHDSKTIEFLYKTNTETDVDIYKC